MLLQQIVDELDAEIDRLAEIRSVVSSLQTTTDQSFDVAVLAPTPEEPAPRKVAQAEKPVTDAKPGGTRVAGLPRARIARKSASKAEAKALTSSIPAGPVVVPRAALAKEKAAKVDGLPAKAAREPRPAPGSLGSMIRALHLDLS